MPNLRISEASLAASLDGSELIPGLQGGNPVRILASQLRGDSVGIQPGRIPKWRRALGNVAAGLGHAKLCIVGDSQVAGWGAGGNVFVNARSSGWPARLTSLLTSAGVYASDASWMGDQNTYQQSTSLAAYDPRITLGAGWVSGAGALTFGAYALTGSNNNSAVTFTPTQTFDTIEVYYATYPGHGLMTISVDSGAVLATVDTNLAAGFAKTTVACARGTHTINVTRIAGGGNGVVSLCGVRAFDSARKEVSVIQGGWSGATAGSWADATYPYSPKPCLTSVAPDLTIIALGGNDWHASTALATFNTNMQAIITAAQTSGDVVMMTDTHTNPATTQTYAQQQPYLDALKTLATTNSCPFVDVAYRWQSYEAANSAGWMSDANHPSASGYLELAKLMARVALTA